MSAEGNTEPKTDRSNQDKRDAVEYFLSHPEWRDWSNSEIARRCDVSPGLVASVRNQQKTKQEIVNE